MRERAIARERSQKAAQSCACAICGDTVAELIVLISGGLGGTQANSSCSRGYTRCRTSSCILAGFCPGSKKHPYAQRTRPGVPAVSGIAALSATWCAHPLADLRQQRTEAARDVDAHVLSGSLSCTLPPAADRAGERARPTHLAHGQQLVAEPRDLLRAH